jgi:regulator of protease activity HflC (stomatin/prohibitin superfamily)
MTTISNAPQAPFNRGRIPLIPTIALGIAGVAALALADASIFTVGQNERAFVRQFGRVENPGAGPIGPGLHVKFPLFTQVDRMPVSIDVMDLGNMDTFTRDAQRITMHVTVTTQVPDAAVYHQL